MLTRLVELVVDLQAVAVSAFVRYDVNCRDRSHICRFTVEIAGSYACGIDLLVRERLGSAGSWCIEVYLSYICWRSNKYEAFEGG